MLLLEGIVISGHHASLQYWQTDATIAFDLLSRPHLVFCLHDKLSVELLKAK